MTRAECEKAILEKCKEILAIYRQYVPGGEELTISFNRWTDGNDEGDWNEQRIKIKNNSWQTVFPDGEYGAYEAHKPLDLLYTEPIEDDAYRAMREKVDAIDGPGWWDDELAEWERQTYAHHESGTIGSDDHWYSYKTWLENHGIEPVYAGDGTNRIMIEEMDCFKGVSTKPEDIKK